MEAPGGEEEGKRAYNSIYSRWHAKDATGGDILNIVGIGSNTVQVLLEDPAPLWGSITLSKQVDKIWTDHGSPSFFFVVEGEDKTGKHHRYVRTITLSPSDQKGEGLYLTSVTVPVLEGEYVATELGVQRYVKRALFDVEGGAVVGEGVKFTISRDSLLGKATFFNRKEEEGGLTDTVLVKNRIG